jgi:integrase
MEVYRRGGTWLYKFWFANKFIRESAKTTSKTLAKGAEKARRRELEEGYNGLTKEDRTKRVQTLSEAADSFVPDYALRRSPSSLRYLKQRIAHLKRHMGNMMLIKITDQTIADYQAARLKEHVSGSPINAEVMYALILMGEIGDAVRLKLKRENRLRFAHRESCGKALSLEEEARLLAAAQVPEVEPGEKMDLKATRSPMIYPAIMLALNTGMRISEVRTIRWGQIDFLKRILTVGKSKTKAGSGRTIPVNTELFNALVAHKTWFTEEACAVAPELYMFPFGECRQYDPKRPISTLKTAWTNVRTSAGINIRFHDLRHTLITKLAESGAGDETILAIAGQVSRQMLSRYAHIRTEAKRQALEAIATKPASPKQSKRKKAKVAS